MSGGQSYQLSDYLEKQPGVVLRKLYQQPSTALAIFRRMLTPLAQTFVQGFLYMPGPMPLSYLDTWVLPSAKLERERALSALRSLHIIQISPPNKDKPQEITLTTNFKNSLRLALEGGGDHNSFGVPSELRVDPSIDTAFLDRYARKKWEDILQYVVSSVGAQSGGGGGSYGGSLKKTVRELLIAGRLVDVRPSSPSGTAITKAGFTFLLQEGNAQVWTLLVLWLEAAPSTGMDPVDMLSFLFMLAWLELGQAYDTNALTEARRNMLPTLVDFGLIYIPRDTRQYFPTRLATSLTSTGSALRAIASGFSAAAANNPGDTTSLGAGNAGTKGFIIVETNYRIYAYTSSPLQIAVLALFTQMRARFPNMVSGRLTRESVRRAVSYGITSDQIISYLATHAHEQMVQYATQHGRPVLPPTVVDQIRLWQLESERMQSVAGFLFKDFDTVEEYMAVSSFAEEIGVLSWKSNTKRMFFASKMEQIRDYLKARKK